MTDFDWRGALKQHTWEEGKIITIARTSYRHRTVVTCYARGRQSTEFANGIFNYQAYIEPILADGSWNSHGTITVPVLPDGRLIMVVEQRPLLGRYKDRPQTIELGSGHATIKLSDFGPYSSLEFPGGGIEQDKTFAAAFLRELVEETGVEEQSATLYRCLRPIFPVVSDLAHRIHLGVLYLSGKKFESFVESDGGLNVLALTPQQVEYNIRSGSIGAGQAGRLAWYFYQEVERARSDPHFHQELEKCGYLSVEIVAIKK